LRLHARRTSSKLQGKYDTRTSLACSRFRVGNARAQSALSFLEDCGALVKARIAIRAVTRDGDDALGEGVRRRLFAESANVVKPRDIQCRQVRVMTFRMVALKFVLETCLYVIRLAFP
jgi:hypothetical protein